MSIAEDAKVAIQTVRGNPSASRASAVASAIGLIALQVQAGKVDDLEKALDQLSSLATKIQNAAT